MSEVERWIPRRTSLDAYNRIKASGELSRMRWLVYDHLYQNGPLTRTELDGGLRSPTEVNPSYHKRLSELERMGVAAVIGERKCQHTGMTCALWDVTDLETPRKLPRKHRPPNLRAENDALRELLARIAPMCRDAWDPTMRVIAKQIDAILAERRNDQTDVLEGSDIKRAPAQP